jgi:hypothetical protein
MWITITNSKSRRTKDCIIRNLYFLLVVDYVPESKLLKYLILLYICSGKTQPARPFYAINRLMSWAAWILCAVNCRILRWDSNIGFGLI